MSANAILAGNYADFKLVKTRRVAQLVIEIPLEQAERAIEMFGLPRPDAEIAVAIARLVKQPEPEPPLSDKSERARMRYREAGAMKQATTRAALLCADPQFQAWILPEGSTLSEKSAAIALREGLGIESRSEIGSNGEAYDGFIRLETSFRQAVGQIAEMRR